MNKSLTKYISTALVTVLVFISTVSLVLARAGGGESFGGGGFDSGGSSSWSSSSSSGGSSFNMGSVGSVGSVGGSLLGNCCSGFIVIAIIIIIIIIMARRGRGPWTGSSIGSNSDNSSGGINPTNKTMSEQEINDNLAKLKEIDPKFDIQKFKTHTKKVFMAVQEGWSERDQKVCRPFMAEEIYQSHQMQIDNMKQDKVINVLKNIVVGSTEVVRIDLGEEYHKIAMRMRASMKDYKVKEDNPDKIIEGSDQQTPPFTEYWMFIRKSNLKTKIKDGLFDRKCPNCGAPIDVDVAGVCKYCNANVVNGDYDWVLSEIIQKSEWSE